VTEKNVDEKFVEYAHFILDMIDKEILSGIGRDFIVDQEG